MGQKNDWTVLVVDDQINVVNGVVNSIDWEKIFVSQVYKAYDAMEAKSILLQNRIDIMLCDIEMPQENGLQLFKWTKEKNLDVECIFLTAHADFVYAKTAIQLGGFDYVLQPAHYSDIENAIVRAEMKIEEKAENTKYYDYGKSIFDDRQYIIDNLYRQWYEDSSDLTLRKRLKEYLFNLDNSITENTYVYPILLEIQEWKNENWDMDLFRYSCTNIIKEILGNEIFRICFIHIMENLWQCLIWKEEGQIANSDLDKKVDKFYSVVSQFFSCELSLYLDTVIKMSEAGNVLIALKKERENNVARKAKIHFVKEPNENKTYSVKEPDYQLWETLLQKGYGKEFEKETEKYLRELAENEELDTYSLQHFYNELSRVLILVEGSKGISNEDILYSAEKMELYLTAYNNLNSMKELIRIIAAYFDEEPDEISKTSGQIAKIKEYIFMNIDKEIRREDLASIVYMNPSYISRIFKREEGISLKDYIIQEKMKMAKSLLVNSALPINVIALKVGYSNFSHFSQVYKKIYQISPTEERK